MATVRRMGTGRFGIFEQKHQQQQQQQPHHIIVNSFMKNDDLRYSHTHNNMCAVGTFELFSGKSYHHLDF